MPQAKRVLCGVGNLCLLEERLYCPQDARPFLGVSRCAARLATRNARGASKILELENGDRRDIAKVDRCLHYHHVRVPAGVYVCSAVPRGEGFRRLNHPNQNNTEITILIK